MIIRGENYSNDKILIRLFQFCAHLFSDIFNILQSQRSSNSQLIFTFSTNSLSNLRNIALLSRCAPRFTFPLSLNASRSKYVSRFISILRGNSSSIASKIFGNVLCSSTIFHLRVRRCDLAQCDRDNASELHQPTVCTRLEGGISRKYNARLTRSC